VQYTSFSGGDILASAIDSIALEIAD
jgi:hypothetical protein